MDNTGRLSSTTWRHVAFVEQMDRVDPAASRWMMMMSDVCKHCTNAGCMEVCPTGAIMRNEFGDVYVQPDVCNGCGYCVPSCPFGVVAIEPRAETLLAQGREARLCLRGRFRAYLQHLE